MADLSATPKETVVGSFRTHSEYDPLPALRRYGGPTLAVVTPVNDAKFDLHNLGVDLPHNAFGTIGHWLRTDKNRGVQLHPGRVYRAGKDHTSAANSGAKKVNTENAQEVESGNAVQRMVHFSDAVVAIAITLLTLELRLPEDLASGEVPGRLLDTLSGLFAFLVSFWVIASYWITHHRILGRIGAHDSALLNINFVFLMWVVLVPFSTSMVMEYGDSRLVWDVYVSHLLLTSLTLSWLWRYASKDERLIEPNADFDMPRRCDSVQAWSTRAMFVLSIVMSFFSVDYAQWFLLFVLPLPTLVGPLRRQLAGRIRRHDRGGV